MTVIDAQTLSCGSCTLCCKELNIEETRKPAGQWCPDCKVGHGCLRYETRPEPCKAFECLWLHSQKPHIDAKLRMPAEFRPDKSKVVLNKKPAGHMFAHVPEDRPDAWKKGKIGDWLRRENAVRPVTIVCGPKAFLMP